MTIEEVKPWMLAAGATVAAGVAAFTKEAVRDSVKNLLLKAKIRFIAACARRPECPVPEVRTLLGTLQSGMHEVMFKINSIAEQVNRNSGHSMSDAIFRIECEVTHFRVASELASEATGVLQWRASPNGEVCYVSKAIKQRVGATSDDELLDWAWLNLVHPEDRDHARHRWEQAVRDECEMQDEYRIYIRPMDLYAKISAYAKPVWIGDRLVGWQGVHRIVGYLGNDKKEIPA